MSKLPPPIALQIERSQPIQGQSVTVLFKAEGQFCGSLKLPFAVWIRFNKLLQKGLEKQQLEGPEAESNGLRVTVKGFVPQEGETHGGDDEFREETTVEQVERSPGLKGLQFHDSLDDLKPGPVYCGGVSNLAMEDEELDPADKAAVEAAERQAVTLEKLGRTLAGEGEEHNGE